MFCEKVVLKKFSKFTGKHLFQSLRPEAKKETLAQNFEKFLKNTFFKRTPPVAASDDPERYL